MYYHDRRQSGLTAMYGRNTHTCKLALGLDVIGGVWHQVRFTFQDEIPRHREARKAPAFE